MGFWQNDIIACLREDGDEENKQMPSTVHLLELQERSVS